ncbi:ABC transporter permease [Spiroplasma gladiatoris]|uniref:ABC transporter permease n=1 Tax=Spiroplasma gladiatoris TaxID=2143 RepID=A0A4P7AJY5_9MOLU|nr:ABC transporter permease [Spiroplasma gladiatoris]QBQ07870.1 ABC transporter permease [Spiroplasma gladiatoris]
MKKISLWLYLKQGLKGVYKFKIQFYVIVILTFISSLILGISLSASTRIINNYKEIVPKMEKFDYVATREVGTVNNKDSKTVPLMDFIDFQFLAKKYSTQPATSDLNSGVGYNFNLISVDKESTNLTGEAKKGKDKFSLQKINDGLKEQYLKNYQETFISKSFEDDSLRSELFNLLSSDNFLETIFHYEYQQFSGVIEYKDTYDKFKKLKISSTTKYADFVDGSTIANNENFNFKKVVFENFIVKGIQILKSNFLNDLKSRASYLKGTTFDKLWEIGIINDNNIDTLFDKSTNSLKNDSVSKYDLYLQTAFTTLLGQIINSAIDYVQYYIDEAISEVSKVNADKIIDNELLKNQFNIVDNKKDNSGFNYYDKTNNQIIANTLFTFIFGNKYNNQTSSKVEQSQKINNMQYNVEGQNFQVPYLQQIDLDYDLMHKEDSINYQNYYCYSKTDKFTRGLRGSLNQLIVTLNNNKPTGSVGRMDVLKLLKFEERGSSLNENLVSEKGFFSFANRNELNRNSINDIKLFYLKSQISAEATNVKVENRAEMNFSDAQQEKKYRLIVLDDLWKSRLTVVSGSYPKADNEILINPQYAKANKIKLGSSISIGGSTFIISGFGVDPLTFFPVSDASVPIPNSKKGLIAFGTESTLSKIITSDYGKFTTKYLNTFVTSKQDKKHKNASYDMLNYYSNMMSNESYLYQSYNAKQKVAEQTNNKKDFKDAQSYIDSFNIGFEKFSTFNDSSLSYNWTVAPKITQIFQVFSYSAASIIALIALAATLIGIKKTIQLNAGEITILKAMGARSSSIAVSYISYGIISCFLIVPIAWVISAFCQEAIVSLLISYTGGAYWQATFDWEAILASFSIFGVLTIGVSYYVAYRLVKKPVLEIAVDASLEKEHKILNKLKKLLTFKRSFSSRFSTELAINGFSKTLLTAITIFLNTFLISGVMAIPGIVKKTLSEYYKNVNYQNSMDNIGVVGNAPLSKTSLSAWKGVESYEDQYIDTKSKLEADIGMVGKTTSSVQPISEHSVIPKVLISESKTNSLSYDWAYNVVTEGLKDESGNPIADSNVISYIASFFGNNLVQMIGKSISIEDIQLLLDWIIHSDNEKYQNLDARKEKILQFSSLLSNGLPAIIKTLFSSIDIESSNGQWKQKIIDVILAQTPAYVRNYVNKSQNRINQYRFGWNFNSYIPTVDSMYTKVNMKSNLKPTTITGLDKTQTALKISQKANNIFFTNEDIKKIQDILYGNVVQNEDLVINNIKVYDAQNKKISIPALVNNESNIIYKFEDNQIKNLKTDQTRLTLAKDGANIPNSAWKYDDRDYQLYKNKSLTKENSWLDPASLSNSKFTYSPVFRGDSENEVGDGFYTKGFDRYNSAKKMVDNTYGFYNLESKVVNGQETLNAEIRPYYQYDNMMLFIPMERYEEFKEIINQGNAINRDAWYGEVSSDKVPEDTKKDWNSILGYSSNKFMWIRPYSLYFEPVKTYSKPKENLTGAETKDLTTIRTNFIQYAFARTNNPISITNDYEIEWNKLSKGNVNEISLLNYENVGVYGESVIIADQSLVNLVNGYNVSRYIPFEFSYEDKSKPSGQYDAGDGTMIDTYKLNKPESQIDPANKEKWVFGDNDFEKSIRPNMWYNGSFSNAIEPYFISTQASFAMDPNIGDYSVNGPNNFLATVELKDYKFLGDQKNLINQISNLVITIGTFFIVFMIIVSTLSIILISDIYVNQYKRFMVVMKALGYSNREVITYTFKFVTIWSLILFALATALSYLTVYLAMHFISLYVISIPMGFVWWTPLVSSLLVVVCYVVAISITTRKIRTQSPTLLIM